MAKLIAEMLDDPGAELRRVRFHCEGSFDDLLAEFGSTPLPPYIKRPSGTSSEDRERYQTIYSKHRGAIAAPTAGLHFTPEVLAEVTEIASLAEITLHVGYGTFEPVRVEDVTDHSVSGEHFEISETAAQTINTARSERWTSDRRWDHDDARARVCCNRRRHSQARQWCRDTHHQARLSISNRGRPADQLSSPTLFPADPRQRLCRT